MNNPDLKSRVFRASLWVLSGKLTTVVLSVAFSGILARLLSPQDFGSFVMVFSILSLVVVLSQMGLGGAAVRLVAESLELGQFARLRSVARVVLSFGALGGIGSALFLSLGPGEWITWRLFGSPAIQAVLPWVGMWVVTATVCSLGSEVFRGLTDFRHATLFGGLLSGLIFTTGLAVCWLLRGTATLGLVVVIGLSSSTASALALAHLLRSRIRSLPVSDNGSVSPGLAFGIGLPLLATDLASLALRQGDIWVIGVSQSPEELGVYGATTRLVTVIGISLWIVNRIASPFIAGTAVNGDVERLERPLRGLTTILAVPVLFALLVFVLMGGQILATVFGEEFRTGANLLTALCTGHAAAAILGPCDATLSMTGHHRILMQIHLAVTSLTLFCMLLVVKPLGTLGVAVVMSLGLGLRSLLAWFAARRLVGIWTHMGSIRRTDLEALVAGRNLARRRQ